MEDASLMKLQPPLIPRIGEGPGAGSSPRIEHEGAVVIRRYPECGFFLDKEFKAASRLDPTNEAARKWLPPAERALDELIDKHYGQGLLACDYLRHDEAPSGFSLVVR